MIYNIYSVRDVHTGFLAPNVNISDGAAKRDFAYAINNADSIMAFNPKDFDLYKLGTFDTDGAVFKTETVPVLIATGISLVGDKNA